jgi:hypothetical protein
MISIEGLQSENGVGSNIPISANPALQQSFAIVSPAELCVRLHKDTLYGSKSKSTASNRHLRKNHLHFHLQFTAQLSKH